MITKNSQLSSDYPSINIQQNVNFLTKYLYANDWNAQDAIKKIVQQYRLKVSASRVDTIWLRYNHLVQSQKDFPAWFALMKVSEFAPIIQIQTRYMLTDRDKNGKRIYVYKCGNCVKDVRTVEL